MLLQTIRRSLDTRVWSHGNGTSAYTHYLFRTKRKIWKVDWQSATKIWISLDYLMTFPIMKTLQLKNVCGTSRQLTKKWTSLTRYNLFIQHWICFDKIFILQSKIYSIFINPSRVMEFCKNRPNARSSNVPKSYFQSQMDFFSFF